MGNSIQQLYRVNKVQKKIPPAFLQKKIKKIPALINKIADLEETAIYSLKKLLKKKKVNTDDKRNFPD